LDDYKWKMMGLVGRMIDSNLVKGNDYAMYFSKLFIEGKQELKKQLINEKKRLIREASMDNLKNDEDDNGGSSDYGNQKLALYAKLLLPFWKTNASVPSFFGQILGSNDKKIKYNTVMLMIRNHEAVPDSMLNYFAGMDDYRF